MKSKISILIPIYNVEKYLRQCLNSVCKQTLSDLEIICINDGSTDGSLDIIKEYQSKDPRIVIIDKANSGYGDSMNQGLKKATGEFIGIVEPDDWVELDTFDKLYTLAEIFDAQVVRANYYKHKAGKDTKQYTVNPIDLGKVVSTKHHTTIFYQSPAIWASIYQRKFLLDNHIDFLPTPGASFQDTSFSFKVFALADRVVFTNGAYLHYRVDNEASSVNNPSKVFNVQIEYAEIEKFLKARGLYSEMAPLMQATKATAYYWNIFRLSPKLLPEFLAKAKAEYTAAQAEGTLLQEYFSDDIFWNLINTLIHKTPRQTIRYVRRQKLKAKAKSGLKKLYQLTHPSYQKQLEVSQLLDEYDAQIDLLNQRIKLLSAKLEENNHD